MRRRSTKTRHDHVNQGSRNSRRDRTGTVNYSLGLPCYIAYLGPCCRKECLGKGGNLIALGWRPNSLRGGNLIAFGWQPYSLKGGNLIAYGWHPDSLFSYFGAELRGQGDHLGGEGSARALGSSECRPRRGGQTCGGRTKAPGHRSGRRGPMQIRRGGDGCGGACWLAAGGRGGHAEGGSERRRGLKYCTARQTHLEPRSRLSSAPRHHQCDHQPFVPNTGRKCRRVGGSADGGGGRRALPTRRTPHPWTAQPMRTQPGLPKATPGRSTTEEACGWTAQGTRWSRLRWVRHRLRGGRQVRPWRNRQRHRRGRGRPLRGHGHGAARLPGPPRWLERNEQRVAQEAQASR